MKLLKKLTNWTIEQIKIQRYNLERVSPNLLNFFNIQKAKYQNHCKWANIKFDLGLD